MHGQQDYYLCISSYFIGIDRGFGSRVPSWFVKRDCDDGPNLMFLDYHLGKIPMPKGMQAIKNEIRVQKTNFRGRKLIIIPSTLVYGTWEGWKELMTKYSFRTAHENANYAYVGLLFLFKEANNFTFDAMAPPVGGWLSARRGFVYMKSGVWCHDYHDCDVPPLPFTSLDYYSTLSFS